MCYNRHYVNKQLVQMNIDNTINNVLSYLEIEADIIPLKFKNHSSISKKLKGIYILNDIVDNEERVIYVGKGQILSRLIKHWAKSNDIKPKDPIGWQWLIKNVKTDPLTWDVRYLILHKQTELSAVEGFLIHKFQPLANNETYLDEGRTV